jgi:hypothetical protein
MSKHVFTETHTRPCFCGKDIEIVTTEIDTKAYRKTITFLTECKECGPSSGSIYVPVCPDKRIQKYLSGKSKIAPKQRKKIDSVYEGLFNLIACDNGESSKEIDKILKVQNSEHEDQVFRSKRTSRFGRKGPDISVQKDQLIHIFQDTITQPEIQA